MRKYRLVAKKGEGTFSEVLKAQNVNDGRYHAIKCMKNRFESIDQVQQLLKSSQSNYVAFEQILQIVHLYNQRCLQLLPSPSI